MNWRVMFLRSFIVGFIFIPVQVFAPEQGYVEFQLVAKKKSDNQLLGNVKVTVIEGNTPLSKYETGVDGKQAVILGFGKIFTLRFERKGFFSMFMEMDTHVPHKRETWNYTYRLILQFLEEDAEGINAQELQEKPFTKVKYHSRGNKFRDDEYYKVRFQKKLYGKRNWKLYRKLERKAKQLEKKQGIEGEEKGW